MKTIHINKTPNGRYRAIVTTGNYAYGVMPRAFADTQKEAIRLLKVILKRS